MAYFLLKTEPSEYSFADLQRQKVTVWDGVANALALKYIKSMEPGDQVVIYHTGEERRAMGTATILSKPYADPKDPKLTVMNVAFEKAFVTPVALATFKADKRFKGFDLVRLPRLSVIPMTAAHWKAALALGGK